MPKESSEHWPCEGGGGGPGAETPDSLVDLRWCLKGRAAGTRATEAEHTDRPIRRRPRKQNTMTGLSEGGHGSRTQ